MSWEKYVFHLEKWNFELIGNSAHKTEFLVLGKAPEYLYRLFDVLPKQATCEMKTPSSTSLLSTMISRELNLSKF